MRLLHVCSHFPISYPGGITNYVRALCSSQSDLGHQVGVVSGPEPSRHGALDSRTKVITHVPRKMRPFAFTFTRTDPAVEDLFAEIASFGPDLIHVHSTVDMGANFYTALAALGVPYVVSLHDYYYLCPRVFLQDRDGGVCGGPLRSDCRKCVGALDQIEPVFRLARKLGVRLPAIPSDGAVSRLDRMRRFLGGARRVLPVSRRVQEIFQESMPDAGYQVVHIGNVTAHAKPEPKSPHSRARVAFLGTLNHMKGAAVLERLIDGVDNPGVEFHFYGRGDASVLERLKAKGLVDHGPYTAGDFDRIMREIDLGMALPVWEDNGPQVVMEMINYGTPVLATRRGGIPDFVTDRNGRLFDPDSPAEVAQILGWLNGLTRDSLRTDFSGMEKLKTPEQHAQELVELYSGILGNSP